MYLLGIVAGITKLGARVGERVAKSTKLKYWSFVYFLPQIDFLGFLGKQKAVEENWKALEENWKAIEENQKAIEDFETCFPYATGSMCAHGFGLVKSSTHNLK